MDKKDYCATSVTQEEDNKSQDDITLLTAEIVVFEKILKDAKTLYKRGAYPDSLYVGCVDDTNSEVKPLRIWLLPKAKLYKNLPPEQKGLAIATWYKKQPFYTSSSVYLAMCEETTNSESRDIAPDPSIMVTSFLPNGKLIKHIEKEGSLEPIKPESED